jgi:hypothetical protein
MDTGYAAPAGHVLTDRYLAGEIAGKPIVSSFIYGIFGKRNQPAQFIDKKDHL